MVKLKNIPLLLISILLLSACSSKNPNISKINQAIPVEIKKMGDSWKILRDGKEFFIKGAGCENGNFKALARHGANSFRTWRTHNKTLSGIQILDTAYKYNLVVSMGIDVGKERHGFDYNDTKLVEEQKERIRNEVEELKDHPSLLFWIIGNELNLHATNPKVWDAVNDIADMIHKTDPAHPVLTTLAGGRKQDIKLIQERCPNLDLIGFQLYGDLINLPKYIKESGWTGPYLVTEWGPTGHWEVGRTIWDRPIEHSSTEKQRDLMYRYNQVIEADKNQCLGSYAFLWGNKQERTPTWYGMFLESGEETEAVDVMHYLWNGEWPANRAPKIDAFVLDQKLASDNIILNTQKVYSAVVTANDRENDSLTYRWEIRKEVEEKSDGGDFEPSTPNLPENFLSIEKNKVEIKAPAIPGEYRILVYVIDSGQKAATANIPFKVI